MIDSIHDSYISQAAEQGRPIVSSENRYYLSALYWKSTVEGEIFWSILHISYAMYGVYDYETLIKLYIRFNSVPHIYVDILDIYGDYFDEVKGTLTSDGFENLIKIC